MDTSKFAAWKYKHKSPGYHSRWHLIGAAVFFGVALFVLFGLRQPAFGFAFLLFGVFFALLDTKKIFLGPRYLICGSCIIYYGNVVRLALDETAGTLTLVTASNQSLTLERDKFPTDARKADKIARNKAAKFSKVAQNIIARVQHAAPGVLITGQT